MASQYTFHAEHSGRAGYVEYQDGQQSIRLPIEMMASGPSFSLYVPELDPELSRTMVDKLKVWLSGTGRYGRIQLPCGTEILVQPKARWLSAGGALGGVIGAVAGFGLTLLVYLIPWHLEFVDAVFFGPAALVDGFFILGDMGTPERQAVNVLRVACLCNSVVGSLVGVAGSVCHTRIRVQRA